MKLLLLSALTFTLSQTTLAQTKQEKFKVAGECGMCKNKIEAAAKKAGATYAAWDVESKELVVKYNNQSSNAAKIQEGIAAVGYDTPKFKATDEAYNKLHGCCKYERTAAASSCCEEGQCTGCDCCKDGVCTKGDCKHNKTQMISENAGKAKACCKKS